MCMQTRWVYCNTSCLRRLKIVHKHSVFLHLHHQTPHPLTAVALTRQCFSTQMRSKICPCLCCSRSLHFTSQLRSSLHIHLLLPNPCRQRRILTIWQWWYLPHRHCYLRRLLLSTLPLPPLNQPLHHWHQAPLHLISLLNNNNTNNRRNQRIHAHHDSLNATTAMSRKLLCGVAHPTVLIHCATLVVSITSNMVIIVHCISVKSSRHHLQQLLPQDPRNVPMLMPTCTKSKMTMTLAFYKSSYSRRIINNVPIAIRRPHLFGGKMS